MRAIGKKCNKVGIKLRYTGESPIIINRTIPFFHNTEENLLPYAQKLMKRIHTRRLAINLIGITLSGLKDTSTQEELFAGPLQKNDSLIKAIDKLRSSFGYHSLYFGKTLTLKDNYKKLRTGYELRTPSLSQ